MTAELDDTVFLASDGRTGIDTPMSETTATDTTEDSPLLANAPLLAQALTAADVGWWTWNRDEQRIHWPDDVVPLFEHSTEPLEYGSFLSVVHPEDRERVDDRWTAVLEGKSHDIEYRLVVDGETHWVRQRVKTETRTDGTMVRALGVVQEITDRKRRERELQSFREAVEHSGHAIYWTDRDGTIQYVNPAFEATTGYAREEVIGETPAILNSGEHDETFYEEMWETITSGDVWSSEITNEHADGEQYVVDQTIAPIGTADDEIERFVAVNRDVTERKERERELEVLRQSVEAAPLSIVLTDPSQKDNPIVYVNEAFEELTGYPAAEAIGRNCRFLQGDNPDPDRLVALDEAVRNETQASVELRNYRKDGTMFWNRVTVTPIHDDEGNVIRYLGTQQDVTRRKQREQRLMVLTRVLRHNLRNKLTAVTGYVSAIEQELDELDRPQSGGPGTEWFPDRIRTRLERIHRNATELASLGEKSREFQQVLEGPRRSDRVDLGPILADLESTYREEFPEATIQVAETDATVSGDKDAFTLAIDELVKNALSHSGEETPHVTVTVSESDGDRVSISVTDTGPGIPEMERTVITENEESPLLHGSGFGLWMVNWLVARLGGNVDISENEPTGTVVTVTLPTP
jgi:PAS domain S-box-containing protein